LRKNRIVTSARFVRYVLLFDRVIAYYWKAIVSSQCHQHHMNNVVHVLLVGALEVDELLVRTELERGQFSYHFGRVRSVSDLETNLGAASWDLAIVGLAEGSFHGVEFIRILHNSRPQLPIVAFSAIPGEEHAVNAMKAGATDYILKRSIEALVPAVEAILVHAGALHSPAVVDTHTRLFTQMAHSVRDILYSYDLKQGSVWFNDAFGAVFEAGEHSGSREQLWTTRIDPLEKIRVQQSLSTILRSGEDTWNERYHILTGGGGYIEVEDKAFIIRDEQGIAEQVVGVIMPVYSSVLPGVHSGASNVADGLTDLLPGYVWRIDASGKVVYLNRALAEITGPVDECSTLEELSSRVHDEEREHFLEYFRVENAGAPVSRRYRLVRKDGNALCVRERCIHLTDAAGNSQGWLGTAMEIVPEEDSSIIQKLRERDRILELISKKSYDIIVILDRHGRFRYLSDSAFTHFGLTEKDVLGETRDDLVHPDDLDFVYDTIRDLCENVDSSVTLTLRWLANGSYRIIESYMHSFTNEAGEVDIISTNRDITEQQNWVTSLQQNEERYRTLFEGMQAGIFITDEDGTILRCNSSAAKHLFFDSPELLIGRTVVDVFSGRCDCAKFLREIHDKGSLFSHEIEFSVPGTEDTSYLLLNATTHSTHDGLTEIDFVVSDISGVKRAQEEVQKSQRYLKGIFDNKRIIIIVLDSNGFIVDWNPAAEYFYKSPKEDAIGTNYLDRFLLPEELDKVKFEINRILSGDARENYDNHIVDTEGNKHLIQWSAVSIASQRGAGPNLVAIGMDITEKKRAEDALRENQASLVGLIENTNDNIWSIDPDYRVLTLNNNFKGNYKILYGVDLQPGMCIVDIPEGKPDEYWKAMYDRALGGERFTVIQEFNVNGEQRFFDVSFNPMYSDSEIFGVSVFAREMTDKIRSEQALRYHQKRDMFISSVSRRFLHSSLDSCDAPIFEALEEVCSLAQCSFAAVAGIEELKDGTGLYARDEHANAVIRALIRALKMLRTQTDTQETGRGCRIADIREFMQIPSELIEGLEHIGIGSLYILPLNISGEENALLVISRFRGARAWNDEDDLLFSTLGELISSFIERKRVHDSLSYERQTLAKRVNDRTAELRAANTELARAARMKDEFLANMSHELRTPLTAILGLTESLKEQISDRLTEKQRNALSVIDESGRHLLSLINDILDLSKIEAGHMTVQNDVHEVDLICKSSLLFIRQMALKKEIEVSYRNPDSTLLLYTDGTRLKQVLVNLLNNSVKFTPNRGRIGLEVRVNEQRNEIEFLVRDTGIGIAEENMSRLFKPFVQLDSSLSRQYDGTGLGLALVASLTDMLGGSVSVQSVLEKGSTFTVTLPLVASQSEDIREMVREIRSSASVDQSEPPLVLLVEDNESNIFTIYQFLTEQGFKVLTARDGYEALDILQETVPAILLMDIQMPGITGTEVIRRIRENPQLGRVPIIALTALAMPGDRERCIKAGADDYIVKPLSLMNLKSSMINLLTKNPVD